MIAKIRTLIYRITDFFYPPFSKFLPLQLFRYLACNGSNVLLDMLLYTFAFTYIFHQQDLVIGGHTIRAFKAAYYLSFCFTFPIGFFLSRYIVFTESDIRGRIQLFRYILLILCCFILTDKLLALFWYGYNHNFISLQNISTTRFAFLAKLITTILVAVFSFFSQRHFTFKIKK